MRLADLQIDTRTGMILENPAERSALKEKGMVRKGHTLASNSAGEMEVTAPMRAARAALSQAVRHKAHLQRSDVERRQGGGVFGGEPLFRSEHEQEFRRAPHDR